MQAHSIFLLDTNVFIEPKNRFYPFDIVPGYWDLLEKELGANSVQSITQVYDEILSGRDDLSRWVKQYVGRVKFINCTNDTAVFNQYLKVSKFVKGLPDKRQNAKDDFLKNSSADPWLAAYACVHKACLVTMEATKAKSPKKVSLVDVCDKFDVRHIDAFQFLRAMQARLVLA